MSQKDRVEIPLDRIPESLEELQEIDALNLPQEQAMAVWQRIARLTGE